jgi:xanthine dehydrogenase YagR molybdenum-binding subunit
MASGVWEALQVPIAVRIALTANGHAEVSCATSDIRYRHLYDLGAGADDMLWVPIDNVTIRLGDSRFPQSPVDGELWIAASVSNGIVTTSEAIREELLRLAKQIPNSPLADTTVESVALSDGKIVSKQDASRAVSIAEAMRQGAWTALTRREPPRSTTIDLRHTTRTRRSSPK